MTFNNIINHLKLWCLNRAEIYQKKSQEQGGMAYVGCQIAYEMEFKLSTLIDRSFNSLEDLRKEILDLINVHYYLSVLKPQNKIEQHIIDKINQEFCNILEDILLANESLELAKIPYKRVIVGSEATALQEKFSSVWGYENTSYWFPLMGEEPQEISEKLFVMFNYFEPYMKQFEEIVALPQEHLYAYGENVFMPPNCIETVELVEYGGNEMIYTDKNFSWVVYFSHENTVAFAGAIVPKVKELLVNEKDYWNKFA